MFDCYTLQKSDKSQSKTLVYFTKKEKRKKKESKTHTNTHTHEGDVGGRERELKTIPWPFNVYQCTLLLWELFPWRNIKKTKNKKIKSTSSS